MTVIIVDGTYSVIHNKYCFKSFDIGECGLNGTRRIQPFPSH